MSIITSRTVPSSDHHCGYYYVPALTTVTIAENKQSVTFGPQINDGILLIDGQLILEP